MKKNLLKVLPLILILALAVFLLVLFFKDPKEHNFFEYNIDDFKKVDKELVSHKETKQIAIDKRPKDFAYSKGHIYILTDTYVQIVTTDGTEMNRIALDTIPNRLAVYGNGDIVVGYGSYISIYSIDNGLLRTSAKINGRPQITSMTVSDTTIYLADAGNRQVLILDSNLNIANAFMGESGVSERHGFILPSLHFDLAVNAEGELWVTNPGLHAIQHYTENGRLRRYWRKPTFDITGFSGCCNPYYIAFLADGSFVTSEKGLVRVKIHKPSGAFSSVVATPLSFPNGKKAPAVAVDSDDNIIILDYDKKMLRFFERIKTENF